MKNYSEKQLIADYFKGDEKSLEILILQYLRPIYSFICRYISDSQEAQDITQEVFLKVWRNLKNFDKNKSFKTWIFSIAKNSSIDFLRKKKTIPFSKFENEEGDNFILEKLADSAPLPPELFEKAETANRLSVALEKISLKYRMILFLRYNDHFTFREIAETFGEPLNTVKSCHRRAIIQLKKILVKL